MDVRKLRAAQTQLERQGLDAGPNALGQPLAAAAVMDELVQAGAQLDARYTTEIAATAAVQAARTGTLATTATVQRPSTVIDPGRDARAIGAPVLTMPTTGDPRMLWLILGGIFVLALIMRARR
jgi:hypothetical protein